MTYKEKLDTLYATSKVDMNRVNSVKDIDLVFDHPTENTLNEFTSFMTRMMQKYNIGKYISKRFWGVKGYQDIQTVLLQQTKALFDRKERPTPMKLMDDLKSRDIGKKTRNYPSYTYMRVARTEGKRMSIIYQLEELKAAGVKYVIYRSRNDSRVRDEHRMLNGREFEIDYLLSPQGEKDRIPTGINCRCRYDMSIRGL
jgi:SPP1 gp7 family putative phage head morphogenesis protein